MTMASMAAFPVQGQEAARIPALLDDGFPVPPANASRALRPYVLYPAWTGCAVLIAAQLVAPAFLLRIQYIPFAVSLVLFGLPHGAVDHLVVSWLRRRPATPRRVAPIVVVYTGLVLAYLGLWSWRPGLALALFLVIALLHWGQGDYFFLVTFLGRPRPRSILGVLLIWVVRGALPIALASLAFPDQFAAVAGGILRPYGSGGTLAIPPQGRLIGLGLLGLLITAYTAQALAAWNRDRAYLVWLDLGEIGVLLVLFLSVPAILAVGVYFCLWHSIRHIARLLLAREPNLASLRRRRIGRPLWNFARDALPATLGALALLGGLYLLHPRSVSSVDGFVYLYLSLIAALTFPHVLVVLWMDDRQEVWRRTDMRPG